MPKLGGGMLIIIRIFLGAIVEHNVLLLGVIPVNITPLNSITTHDYVRNHFHDTLSYLIAHYYAQLSTLFVFRLKLSH